MLDVHLCVERDANTMNSDCQKHNTKIINIDTVSIAQPLPLKKPCRSSKYLYFCGSDVRRGFSLSLSLSLSSEHLARESIVPVELTIASLWSYWSSIRKGTHTALQSVIYCKLTPALLVPHSSGCSNVVSRFVFHCPAWRN